MNDLYNLYDSFLHTLMTKKKKITKKAVKEPKLSELTNGSVGFSPSYVARVKGYEQSQIRYMIRSKIIAAKNINPLGKKPVYAISEDEMNKIPMKETRTSKAA
jgi:hypothetical protein